MDTHKTAAALRVLADLIETGRADVYAGGLISGTGTRTQAETIGAALDNVATERWTGEEPSWEYQEYRGRLLGHDVRISHELD